ncbi:hypothetical protein HGRIS_013589 [Hohenbuehelia grisea]
MPLVQKIMFWLGIIMFVLTTVQLGLVLQQVTVAVVPLANARAQVAIAMIQFMMGDSILIWRVWVVWNRSWKATIVPVALMLAAAGARTPIIISPVLVRAFVSDIASIIIVVNVGLCTLLIGGRIWYIQREVSKNLNSPYRRTYKAVMLLLIESGGLYFISQLLGIILSKVHNLGVHTVLDIQVPLIGILPTLIVLLVYLEMVPGSKVVQEDISTTGRISFRNHNHARSRVTALSLDADVELGDVKLDEGDSEPEIDRATSGGHLVGQITYPDQALSRSS